MGTPLRQSNFYRRAWLPAVARAGLPGIHFHDLRHAWNTLTADAGASLRELMDRMGHSSTRAALIYQHSSDERQRKLADAVGEAAGGTPQDSDTIWHARGTRGQRPIVKVCRRPGYMAVDLAFQKARPAGFEPAGPSRSVPLSIAGVHGEVPSVTGCSSICDPAVRQLMLIDAPVVLGWQRWRD